MVNTTEGGGGELTENGEYLVVLDDLKWTGDNEAERVKTFSLVEDDVTGCAVDDVEVDGESAQTSITGQTEGGMHVEHLAVKVHTDVGHHIFGTIV